MFYIDKIFICKCLLGLIARYCLFKLSSIVQQALPPPRRGGVADEKCRLVRQLIHCYGALRSREDGRPELLFRPLGLLFFFRAHITSFHTDSFLITCVSLSYFILAVDMLECLGKHSCTSCIFGIAILNGNCFYVTAQLHEHKRRSSRNSLVG